jgi:peptidoglycan-associated lipoprotein
MISIKPFSLGIIALGACCLLVSSGCSRRPGEVWDDTKSCGRHITRGVRALAGKADASRQVNSKEEFIGWQEEPQYETSFQESEYVSIPDFKNSSEVAMADFVTPQPMETPGDPGSSVPGISAFSDPMTVSSLRAIFRNVQFDYNSNLVKGKENSEIIHKIASYMKDHRNTYIFVEGHCDERGPEAYNLALGARRSNAVRSMLVQEGVNGDNVFTISYGAERPLVLESNDDAWAQNRRAEFKVYQR